MGRGRSNCTSFFPTQNASVVAWLRLQASSQSDGEWTPNIVDVLNAGSPVVQTDTDRRFAVGTSVNGLPTMVSDGSDVHVWPISPALTSTTKLGIMFWVKVGSIAAANQIFFAIFNGAGGASARKIQTGIATSGLQTSVWVDASTGRNINSATGLISANTWFNFYMQYDSSRGGDTNVAHYINGSLIAQGANTNIGVGNPLGALVSATGNATLGGQTDSDTPGNPILSGGEFGPNIFIFNENLTDSQINNLSAFERPT